MDVVTDLTSYTVSYILVLQDIIRCETARNGLAVKTAYPIWRAYRDLRPDPEAAAKGQQALIDPDKFARDIEIKLAELIWSSNKILGVRERNEFFLHACDDLTDWLAAWHQPGDAQPVGALDFTPYQWRKAISRILYTSPESRIKLATALHYMPIQIIFCLGGKNDDARLQRLYQVWAPKEHYLPITREDKRINNSWWEQDMVIKKPLQQWTTGNTHTTSQEQILELKRDLIAHELLGDDQWIRAQLLATRNPIPFDSYFHQELDEIAASRQKRLPEVDEIVNPEQLQVSIPEKEGGLKPQWELKLAELAGKTKQPYTGQETHLAAVPPASEAAADATDATTPPDHRLPPGERASKMALVGLAFSGGGIRSATFNLGVLQQLAERKILQRVDYLSTVSGGGYIGSWLVAWARQLGSISKVGNRLNTTKAIDPLADEVRPIRWLRMFSNYLTPNASIMSADSWTLGLTWLRNTLLNQMILLLFTCTCICGVLLLYYSWRTVADLQPNTLNEWQLFLAGAATLWPPCILIGLGMNAMNNQRLPRWNTIGRNPWMPIALGAWGFVAVFFISTWMLPNQGDALPAYSDLVTRLWPVALAGLLGIVATAYLGNYRNHWRISAIGMWGDVAIWLSSAVATAVSLLLLAGVWYFCITQVGIQKQNFPDFGYRLVFMLSLPLLLEVFSIAVVMRMAIMGRLFPDDRREWWAKMGAIKHRFSLLWALVSFAALLFWQLVEPPLNTVNAPALVTAAGGWTAIVGWAVKLAYNSGTPDASKSGLGVREIFIRFAPYLFIAGFVLLNSILVTELVYDPAKANPGNPAEPAWNFFVLTLVLAATTALFSWRVGVNEFSLHYFYRNRLVRAYLGAIRRRTDRSRTVNDFTGFDEKDDPCLAGFTTAEGYCGPYPLLNTALNATVVSELDRQDRKAESFVFSPLYCGFDISPTRSSSYNKFKVFEYGYRPTAQYAYPEGPTLGTALAISGAAVSPNMGYHSASATAFLLTVFNVRMGWWMGNPRRTTWQQSDPGFGLTYIINDLIGKSTLNARYVNLSDGGHFDNMGLYELVRRRCSYIILSDAEEDQNALCEGLANAIRRCYIDFGVRIDIDISPIVEEHTTHVQTGIIYYPEDMANPGTLIYIKTVITGDEPTDIREYNKRNQLFPNQSTSDQFFDEAQFESYRMLGYHSLEGKDKTVPPVFPKKSGSDGQQLSASGNLVLK